MKRFRSAASLALAVVAALGLAGPTPAGHPVPFRGSLDGDVTHTSVDPRTDFAIVEATGTATHLGRFAVTAPHFVDTPTRMAAGSYEFTTANGDTLTAEFIGQSSPTATPGVLSIVEVATITGGTGRFAAATGGFVVEPLFDRIAGTTIGSLEGTLSSPGRRNSSGRRVPTAKEDDHRPVTAPTSGPREGT